MLPRAKLIKWMAGLCLLGMTSLAFAQAATVQQALDEFKSASQELVKLHASIKDEASAKAAQTQMDAATKRQRDAEASMAEAMKKLDVNDQQDAKMMEAAYAEMQAQNKAVADAQLKAIEVQSAAKAAAAAAPKE